MLDQTRDKTNIVQLETEETIVFHHKSVLNLHHSATIKQIIQ